MNNKVSKIFVNNFHQPAYSIGLRDEETNKTHNTILGFQSTIDKNESKRRIISDVFQSLLLHDKLVVLTSEFLEIVRAFGLPDAIKLLKSEKFELIDDGICFDMIHINDKRLSLSSVFYAGKNKNITSTMEWLEDKLSDEARLNKKITDVLLLNIDKYNTTINGTQIADVTEKEITFDLSNKQLTNYLDISTKSHDDIVKQDAYSILRLASMNKSLAYASTLSIESIVVDAEIKPILNKKLSPLLSHDKSVNLFDSYFENLFDKKSIPNLSELYERKIISIDDFLSIVSTLSSKQFRNWIKDKSFNIKEIEADLLKSAPQLSNSAIKFIRWMLPDVIGFINPVAGIIASFSDSYIVEKLMQGWHPNIFLDDVLKNQIDKKLLAHKRIEKQEQIKSKFPGVDRNDKCPCDSGKKFKKCCGQ